LQWNPEIKLPLDKDVGSELNQEDVAADILLGLPFP
jgi:hypothetical protein